MAGVDNRADLQVAVDSLLAFLRIKGGQGPNALRLDLDPSIDVTDFYGAQSLVSTQESLSAQSGSFTAVGTAALNARRYLALSAALTQGAAAGTVCSISIGFRLNINNLVNVYWATNGPFAAAAAQNYRVAADVRGVILPPGHQIVVRVDGNATGNDHAITFEYAYQRLDGLP